MAISKIAGKVQTVLGVMASQDVGVTLPHEHFLIDGKGTFREPEAASDRALAYQPIDWHNLSWLRYHPYQNLDNMRLLDEQEAIDEAMIFKKAGGRTVVDVTVNGIGRDPKALARISRITGLNVVMGAGYYVASSLNPGADAKTEAEITDEIVQDITIGVGGTGIRSGLIGEIGCSWPLHANEDKVLRAAAKAQQKTGACLSVHPGRNRQAPFDVIDILEQSGTDLSRVIICHIDARVRDHEGRTQLLKKDCVLEYDLCGWEGHFPTYWTADDYMDLPNDTQRIYEIRRHIEEGYGNQIVMSHDICAKTRRVRYGGWGYAHILNYMVPMMRQRSITQAQIDAIMVENPKRLLTFV